MKVGIISDTHLRHSTPRQVADATRRMADLGAEVGVVAGDVGEGPSAFRRCLALIRSRFPGDVLVLAGNHDLWNAPGHRAAPSRDLWDTVLPAMIADSGCIDLERAVWFRDGIAVAGSIGWYDYSATEDRPPCPPAYYEINKWRHCKDADHIDWPLSDTGFANQVGEALAERLSRLEDDDAVDRVLVATHMPAFEQQLRMELSGNAYFGNLTLGGRIAKFRKVRWVISGHTHQLACRTVLRDGPDILAAVVPSRYGDPGFVIIDTEQPGMYASSTDQ